MSEQMFYKDSTVSSSQLKKFAQDAWKIKLCDMPSEKDYFLNARENVFMCSSDDAERGKTMQATTGGSHGKTSELNSNEYMNIDEFLMRTAESGASEVEDVNKPDVDLLGSLIALGKAVVERQLKPGYSSSSTRDSRACVSVTNSLPPCSSPVPSPGPSCSSYEPGVSLTAEASAKSEKSHPPFPSTFRFKARRTRGYRSKLKTAHQAVTQAGSDSAPCERREKNTLAAREFREARRRKELEVMSLYKLAESENAKLKARLSILKTRNMVLEARCNEVVRKMSAKGRCACSSNSYSS